MLRNPLGAERFQQAVDEGRLSRQDLDPRRLRREPRGAIDLGKGLQASRFAAAIPARSGSTSSARDRNRRESEGGDDLSGSAA